MADVSFLNAHRFVRTSAIDGRREHPASSISGRDRPVVTKANRGASCPRAGGAPEPPQSGGIGNPITVSGGSSGARPSKDAHTVDEEVEASPTKRTPWPIGLHSVEERRKKEEEEREREEQQQLQEKQQLQEQQQLPEKQQQP